MSHGLSPEEEARVLLQKRAGMALRVFKFIAGRGKRGATCDECLVALGLDHQSGSPRFGELLKSKCVVPSGQKRATRSGKLAVVGVVPPGGTFAPYLSFKATPSTSKGLSPSDQAILDAARTFLARWRRVRTEAKQQDAVDTLLRTLVQIGEEPV